MPTVDDAAPAAPAVEAPSSAGLVVTSLRWIGRLLASWPMGAAIGAVAAWMLLIYSLSALTSQPGGSVGGLAYVLNLGHAPLFGLLALWMSLLLPREEGWPRLTGSERGWLLFTVLIYAFSDEFHQSLVAGRSPSVFDIVTDLVGASVTLGVIAHLADAGASERGLRLRLGLGVLACLVAAWLATYVPGWFGSPRWL